MYNVYRYLNIEISTINMGIIWRLLSILSRLRFLQSLFGNIILTSIMLWHLSKKIKNLYLGKPYSIIELGLVDCHRLLNYLINNVLSWFLMYGNPIFSKIGRWKCKINSGKGKISLGMCGRFSLAELVSVTISVGVVCVWVLTGHWALMDFLGMGLCVAFIAFVRLPSLKVSTLLLTGLLLYDVFWVFFSQV